MKYTLLITLQLFAITAFSQLDLPSWLQSNDTGEYLTVKGGIFAGADSASSEGYVTVIRHGSSKDLYRFNYKQSTSFTIFLPVNGHYSLKFEKDGYITKTVDVYTTNIPKKTWRNYFSLDLNAQLQEAPQGFDKSVSMIPCMIAKFDPEIKFFVFDEEFAKTRKEATDKEIGRCKQNL
jgi:hypothetical protein